MSHRPGEPIRLDAEATAKFIEMLEANPVYCTVCGAHALYDVATATPGVREPRCTEHASERPGEWGDNDD